MKKIGISAGLYINNKFFNDYKMSCVSNNYMNSIAKAGAIPFVIPCIANEKMLDDIVKSLDGIVLSGGEDCSPQLYGEEMLNKCGNITPERDDADVMLIKKALENGTPILGVCRGSQMLNVVAGGTLYQDLSYTDQEVFLKHIQGKDQSTKCHKVKIEKDSFLDELYNDEVWVNSFHHQSIKDLAPEFKITAKSPDGIVEGFEAIDKSKKLFGVQWHPEMLAARDDESMLNLFKKFIEKL